MMQLGSLFGLWFSPSVSLSFSLSLSNSRSAILTPHPPTAETLPHLRSSTTINVVELQPIANLKSGGMNGHLSLCNGDPCPLIFRSPVTGMEDIMHNQVLCAIYKLPDFHKHITRPPAGVIFPKKSVTLGDLKPALVLWHENSGRRPWESRRLLNMGMREALYYSKPA